MFVVGAKHLLAYITYRTYETYRASKCFVPTCDRKQKPSASILFVFDSIISETHKQTQ